jgi:hypothetical protein
LSLNEKEMQRLLNICNDFSKKWALEFNVSKCKYLVFGSKKVNKFNLLLNGLPLSYSNNIRYLGIEFINNLEFSDFFIGKFLTVFNAFFSLNSFGFKQGGINPFLQSFIYKSFCISQYDVNKI